jgi:hypothetical protein
MTIKDKLEENLSKGKEFVQDLHIEEKLEKAREALKEAYEAINVKIEEIRQDEELNAKIDEAKDKVVTETIRVVDDLNVDDKLEKAQVVLKEAFDAVSLKIEELRHDEELREKIRAARDKVVHKTIEVVDDIKENENVQKTVKNVQERAQEFSEDLNKNETFQQVVKTVKESAQRVTEKTQEFFERPDVQEKIEDLKDKTIEVAELGVDKLKKVLRTQDDSAKTDDKDPE